MDVTPQSIRAVQFREKLRGYHPDDVDAFVASVAKGVEELEARVKLAESRVAEAEARQSGTSEAEESLRRTLVLAQRTADAAIQEARDEAARVAAESAEQRAEADAELATLRQRLAVEVEQERSSLRQELVAERAALLADIAALTAHLERERERLRIYFTDQLRRVEEGVPGVAASPDMQAPDAPPAAEDDAAAEPAHAAHGADPAADATAAVAGGGPTDTDVGTDGAPAAEDEDPFLAELRRAVNDDKPLGPRDDEPGTRPAGPADETADDDGFDLFAKGEDDEGRFGSRRRRRR